MGSEKKKPTAVALRYDRRQDDAPRVIAKGSGHLAEQIARLAREAGVPVVEDGGLADALASLDLDTEIPPALYRAVAEVLAFVYRLERGTAGPNPDLGSSRRRPADEGDDGQS